MSESDKFKLTDQEQNSYLWKKFKAYFEALLLAERMKNDHDQADRGTAVRGKIALLKTLIALDAKEKQEQEPEQE